MRKGGLQHEGREDTDCKGFNSLVEERFVDFSRQLLTIEKVKQLHVRVGEMLVVSCLMVKRNGFI